MSPDDRRVEPEVALVSMPFALLQHPSLGLGLLKAGLARRGIAARVHNLHFRLARSIGTDVYRHVVDLPAQQLGGDWLFRDALFGAGTSTSDRDYVREVLGIPFVPPMLNDVRAKIAAFVDDCHRGIDWGRYRIIGFTSVLQQHVASLALAKRIKEQHPHVMVVFGGANCEGPMGAATFRAFPFVDAVFSGEADDAFPVFVERVLAGEPAGDLPGLLHRGRAARRSLVARAPVDAAPVHAMDTLPYPDFDEYFDELAQADLPDVAPRLMFETSRGCWWGQKQHCTFCGLNGSTMAFRHKSADRALDEIRHLLDRYGDRTRAFSAADNIIPLDYFKDLLPRLADMKLELDLFYETKSNLRKDQIALYRRAGLRDIQPGVESLVTRILRLMRKGVTRLQNVQVLKWCRQYGVTPHWNYILGFPGERPDDYVDQESLVRAVAHLEPPGQWGNVRFDRFSPYFAEPGSFGVRDLRPAPAYAHVYPSLAPEERRDLAYFFAGDYDALASVDEHTGALRAALEDWKTNADRYALFAMPGARRLQIFDFRPGAPATVVTLEGLDRAVHDACDAVASRGAIARRIAEGGTEAGDDAIEAALGRLRARRLVIEEDGAHLALAVPVGDGYAPSAAVRGRMRELMAPPSSAA